MSKEIIMVMAIFTWLFLASFGLTALIWFSFPWWVASFMTAGVVLVWMWAATVRP